MTIQGGIQTYTHIDWNLGEIKKRAIFNTAADLGDVVDDDTYGLVSGFFTLIIDRRLHERQHLADSSHSIQSKPANDYSLALGY